jgi:nitroreductase
MSFGTVHMNTIEALLTRRSIRKFTGEAVPAPVVRELLYAAMYAPSAGDARPWHFVVIDDPGLLQAVLNSPGYDNIRQPAPMGILVCGDPTLEKFPGFWPQDVSAATQNLLLAAHENGLGAVWTGVYPLEERVGRFRAWFGLPQHVVPLALVLLGYPDEAPEREERFDAERVHHNRWGAQA